MNSDPSPEPQTRTACSERIESLDLYRGLALLVILIDHLELVTGRSILSRLTLHQIGLADGLDAFVFISGCVFGIVHQRIQSKSFLQSQWKALRRAAFLLAANAVAFIAIVPIVFLCRTNTFAVQMMRTSDVLLYPVSAVIAAATTMIQPFGFDLLPLYAVILLIAPLMLWISRHTVLGALLLSAWLYAASLMLPQLSLWTMDGRWWSYQPLGWQFVFVLGMLSSRLSLPSRPWQIRLPVAILSLIAFIVLSFDAPRLTAVCFQHNANWLVGRMIPGPLRIAHFASLALCLAAVDSLTNRLPKWKILDGIKLIGKYPLPVFLFGLWFTFVVAFGVTAPSSSELLLSEANGILLSLLVAAIANWWHHRDGVPATSSSDK